MPDIFHRMLNLHSYTFIARLSLPLILAGFGLRSLSQKAYRQRLDERLGFLGKQELKGGGIVIHAASVGEVLALKPFIQQVIQQFDTPITVTTFTPTGSEQVRVSFGANVQHCFLPIDSPGCVKRFLNRLRPKVIVLMETEIWPNLLAAAHARGIKTLLINGRISERSFPKYQKISSLVAPALNTVNHVLTQSAEDLERFIALGANSLTTRVMGNLKYDINPSNDLREHADSLLQKIGERPIWVIGSTHEKEETSYIAAIKLVLEKRPNSLVIIAPRHIERVEPLAKSLDKNGLVYIKRSENTVPSNDHNIWLIDTLGELMLFYAIAHVTTVAGSFDDTGGHNPLEPASLKKAITCGPNMKNFQEISTKLLERNGMVQVDSVESLAESIIEMMDAFCSSNNCDSNKNANENDQKMYTTLGENAFEVVHENQGATTTAINALKTLYTT